MRCKQELVWHGTPAQFNLMKANMFMIIGMIQLHVVFLDWLQVPGKIVLYNHDWEGYVTTFRRTGAIEASKYGAVASAIRSLASYSLYSPHTGSMVHLALI